MKYSMELIQETIQKARNLRIEALKNKEITKVVELNWVDRRDKTTEIMEDVKIWDERLEDVIDRLLEIQNKHPSIQIIIEKGPTTDETDLYLVNTRPETDEELNTRRNKKAIEMLEQNEKLRNLSALEEKELYLKLKAKYEDELFERQSD